MMKWISSKQFYFLGLLYCITCKCRMAPPNPGMDGIYSAVGEIKVSLEDVRVLVPVSLCIMHKNQHLLSSVPAVRCLPHNLQRQIL